MTGEGDEARAARAGWWRPAAPGLELKLASWGARVPRRVREVAAVLGQGWPLVAAIVIAAGTWPYAILVPASGLDPSWLIGLHLAATQGLDFGHEILFTYGPLGFLMIPALAPGVSGALALVFTALVRIGFALTVILLTRRQFGWLTAVALAYLLSVAFASLGGELLGAMVVIWGLATLDGRRWARLGSSGSWLLGLSAAIALLIKWNVGFASALVLLLASFWYPPGGWRAALRFVGGFVGGFLVLWVATRNDVTDVWAWVHGSVEIAVGYTKAMASEDTTRNIGWQYPVFAALGVLLTALIGWHMRERGIWRAVATVAATAIAVWAAFKHGFVRHGLSHSLGAFSLVSAITLACAWRGLERLAALAISAAALAAALVTLHMIGAPWGAVLDPGPRWELAVDEVGTVLSARERQRQVDEAGKAMAAALQIDPQILADVTGRTVHVMPYETAAILAYGLEWKPLPVFQTYLAYTPYLDRLNAKALAGEDAPDVVLRQDVPRLAGHAPPWESPAENLELLCGYQVVREVGAWQELVRSRDRCGSPELIGTVEAGPGELVSVPRGAPSSIVVARIATHASLGGRLRNAIFRPGQFPTLTIDGSVLTYIPGPLLEGPLAMRVPPSSGYPPGYALFADINEFVLDAAGDYRVDFYEIPFEAP